MEQFREHPEYPGYMVGDKGTIKSANGKTLKATTLKGGYKTIDVYTNNGSVTRKRLATFIAEAWLENPYKEKRAMLIKKNGDFSLSNIVWPATNQKIKEEVIQPRLIKGPLSLTVTEVVSKRLSELDSEIKTYKKSGKYRAQLKAALSSYALNEEILKQMTAKAAV